MDDIQEKVALAYRDYIDKHDCKPDYLLLSQENHHALTLASNEVMLINNYFGIPILSRHYNYHDKIAKNLIHFLGK